MITIIANGKKHQAPAGWHEVTVGMAEQIATWNGKDKIELFNILTGTEYEAVKASTDLGSVFWDVIQFVYFPAPVVSAKLPRQIAFDKGHVIDIPKKVGRLTIGQLIAVRDKMEHVQARIEKQVKDDPDYTKFFFTKDFLFDEMISWPVAVYLQPLYDKAQFDTDRAVNIQQFVRQMPVTKIYPIAFFFFNRQLNFGRGSIKHSCLKIAQKMQSGLRWQKWPKLIY